MRTWFPLVVLSLLIITGIARAADAPNIVLIISDDHAWTDYSFMGHEIVRTPHLDKLASQSMTFTRGYVPGSLCRPSLASMVTGLYPWQHGICGNDPAPKSAELREALISHIDDAPTLPRLLQQKGYLSHQSGKWWEGNYKRGGFTHGMTRGFPQPGGRHGDDGLKIGRDGMKPVLDFIDHAQAEDKPFFIWYAPFLPHTPHNPPQRLLDKYKDRVEHMPVAKYYAMIDWFDETCGELLGYLDEKKIADNTLVIYVTDNGWINLPDRSAYAPRSKRSPYDGGLRTPLMLRWPGVIKPRMDKERPVMSIDIAPTVLAACGLAPHNDMQGVNLLELCTEHWRNTNARAATRDIIFGDNHLHDQPDVNNPGDNLAQRWCIQGRYKLIVPHEKNAGGEKVELFDVIADPYEQTSLAARKPDIVKDLTAKLDAWWAPK